MTHASLSTSALRGMLWVAWAKAGRAVLQLAVLTVLARLVRPEDFGLVSAAFVVIGFAAVFGHVGLGKGLVQHPALRDEHIAVAFYSSLLLGVTLAALTWGFSNVIAGLFRIDRLGVVLSVMAISFPLKAISIVPESLLQRDLQFRWLANRELASYAFGYGCVGVALAYVGWGAWALVAAHLAQTAANTALLLIARPVRLFVRPERRAFHDLVYFSGGYTLGRIANHLASEGDNLVVGRTLGPAALGLYGRAFQLMAVPADIVGDILDNVLFPTMARKQHDNETLANVYRRGVSLVALVALPCSVFFVLLAPEIVAVTLGPRWSAAVIPFQLLAVGLLFRTSCRMSDALARARGFVYSRAWRQGLYAACVMSGAWIGHFWGLRGAALGVLVALSINFFLMAQLSLRIGDMTWESFFRAHTAALALACSLGATVQATRMVMLQWSIPPTGLLAGTATVAACTAIMLTDSFPRVFLGSDGLWLVEIVGSYLRGLRRSSAGVSLSSIVDVHRS